MTTVTLNTTSDGDRVEWTYWYPHDWAQWQVMGPAPGYLQGMTGFWQLLADYGPDVGILPDGSTSMFHMETCSLGGVLSNLRLQVFHFYNNDPLITMRNTFVLKVDGVEYVQAEQTQIVGGGYTFFLDFPLDPTTGLPWTAARINSMQFGIVYSGQGDPSEVWQVLQVLVTSPGGRRPRAQWLHGY